MTSIVGNMKKRKTIITVSVSPCWFCTWKPSKGNADFRKVDGAFFVFCPQCGFELVNSQFLIGDDIEE